MDHKRAGIIELFENGQTSGEILKLLNLPKSQRKFVYRTIRRFNETGGIGDKPRSGRPCTVTTPKLVKVVRERFRRNPRRSMRKMASELKVSRRSIQRVVTTKLGMCSFKGKKVHYLSATVKEKRLRRSKELLKRHALHGLNSILFSDEKIFTIQEATNSQNDRIIASSTSSIEEKFRYVGRTQKPKSVMVWAGVSAIGRTQLIFVPPGMKINATSYCELILEPVLKDLGLKMFEGQSFVFQQDGRQPIPQTSLRPGFSRIFQNLLEKMNGHPIVQI